MQTICSGMVLAALLLAPAAARAGPGLASEKEKVSYALGMDLGNKLRKMPLDVDPAVAGKGLEDALAGRKTLLTEEEARTVLATMHSELKARQGAMLSAQAGEAYLADNARKPGVVVLASGLQYKVLQEGKGRKPTLADAVEVHYRGTFVNGSEFDSSYRRGRTSTFKLQGEVVPGWAEALQLMAEGARWQIVIPPRLAYGERGSGTVPPNATLVFELELVAVR